MEDPKIYAMSVIMSNRVIGREIRGHNYRDNKPSEILNDLDNSREQEGYVDGSERESLDGEWITVVREPKRKKRTASRCEKTDEKDGKSD
jgi:hypothetical protein